MSTRELIENYTAYTDALELSHSAAADSTARSFSPFTPFPNTLPDTLPFPQFPPFPLVSISAG